MQKILLAVNNMNMNGIKTSLLNMIKFLDLSKFKVTIFLLEKKGILLDAIPEGIEVISFGEFAEIREMAYLPFFSAVKTLAADKRYMELCKYCWFSFGAYLFQDSGILYRYLLKRLPGLDMRYDYAVSYFGPLDPLSYYILFRTRAVKKVQWIHFDVSRIHLNVNFARKYYKKFDQIITVSEKAKQVLEKTLPGLPVECFILPVPGQQIRDLSKENTVHYCHEKFQIVTIGRLMPQKGPDIALEVAKDLKDRGIAFEWRFIGGGEMYESLERDRIANGLEKYFYLVGEEINPFRYLPEADLYVQPSRYEGYGLTLQEARIMGLPIICTDFAGASEQIENGVNGRIVDISKEALLQAILDILGDVKLREKFHLALQDETFSDRDCLKYQELYPEEKHVQDK